ncbi:unnamed protein product [Protopolystoma xenopodis]|uniref:Uncharacterized protein n=1 Tax=Protopolystoma xenopodis TaxID=117903 RepID=A0A3S4ZLV2_9PLAT|nr:unnamed protein product [Protopolystoma xenopodis]
MSDSTFTHSASEQVSEQVPIPGAFTPLFAGATANTNDVYGNSLSCSFSTHSTINTPQLQTSGLLPMTAGTATRLPWGLVNLSRLVRLRFIHGFRPLHSLISSKNALSDVQGHSLSALHRTTLASDNSSKIYKSASCMTFVKVEAEVYNTSDCLVLVRVELLEPDSTITVLTDDAGEASGNVPRPRSDFGNDHVYNELWTICVPLNLPTNMSKIRLLSLWFTYFTRPLPPRRLGMYHVDGPTLEVIMHSMDSGLATNKYLFFLHARSPINEYINTYFYLLTTFILISHFISPENRSLVQPCVKLAPLDNPVDPLDRAQDRRISPLSPKSQRPLLLLWVGLTSRQLLLRPGEARRLNLTGLAPHSGIYELNSICLKAAIVSRHTLGRLSPTNATGFTAIPDKPIISPALQANAVFVRQDNNFSTILTVT